MSDTDTSRSVCPGCSRKGSPVGAETLRSLVRPEILERLGELGRFRFCATPTCPLVYYDPQDPSRRVVTGEVRVPVFAKGGDPARPVCYCFDVSVADIVGEVAATGSSRIPAEIAAKCRQGLDRCETTNPKGTCCLGDVRRVLQEAQVGHGGPSEVAAGEACGCGPTAAGDASASGPVEPEGARTGEARPVGLWATGGAVLAAILSSACCWLPLLLLLFGASAAGVAGFFDAYRPWFLLATGLLLGTGFYLVYFRAPRCAPGEACARTGRLQRFNRAMLWVATVVAALFAAFPHYVGALIGATSDVPHPPTAVSEESLEVAIPVAGMTCAGCSSLLAARLRDVPGVLSAEVDYPAATARLSLRGGTSLEPILAAIADEGFEPGPPLRE